MGHGLGWYGELPDDVAVKAKDMDSVGGQLRKLADDRSALAALGKRAKQYVAKNFSHEQYVTALEKLIKTDRRKDGINQKLALELKEDRIKSSRQYLEFLEENREL
jgi:hypothetical protein